MTILPNHYYHYEYANSTFITKTYFMGNDIWSNDVTKLQGHENCMSHWEFERVANQPNSPLSNIFEVLPETHPEYFV